MLLPLLLRPSTIGRSTLSASILLASHGVFAANIPGLSIDPEVFSFELSGVLMEDFTYLDQLSRYNAPASQWTTRRSSIAAQMTFLDFVSLELDLGVDLEKDEYEWRDVNVSLDLPNKWEFNAGKMKQNFGILHSSSLKNQLSPERPIALDLLSLERGTGIALQKSFGRNYLGVAYFDGDEQEDTKVTSVLANYVFESDSSSYWHAGLSVASEAYDQSVYRAQTQAATDVMDDFLRTEKITADRVNYFGPNFAWQSGRLTVLSEHLQTQVKSKLEGDRTYSGSYIQASWFLSDHQHRFNEGSLKSLPMGNTKALELVSTFSRLDAYSEGDGFAADTFGIGVNYYLNENLKLMSELNHLSVNRGDYAGDSGMSLVVRFQLEF